MKRILVAPLNWGLGHVTRCIPIIQSLERMDATVFLASDGVALHLLRAEFPHLPILELPSYRVRYASENMVRNIAAQLPRILYAVRAEYYALEAIVQEHKIDGIISDNRYGCFSKQANSVLLTHQLHLRVPNKALQWAANHTLRIAFSQFDAVWVPDAADDHQNLSGELSHKPVAVHKNVRFIGPLSRLQHTLEEQEYDVAVVLSGPEPQRTILEQLLLEQAMLLPHKFIFIQGKTQSKTHQFVAENVEMVSYLTSAELNSVLATTHTIVCRSGYSSIMDLVALGKKAIIIPTPGQTEQEYLAEFLGTKQIFCVQAQKNLDLETALELVDHTKGFEPGAFQTGQYETTLTEWLTQANYKEV